jgi:hypothetical protein
MDIDAVTRRLQILEIQIRPNSVKRLGVIQGVEVPALTTAQIKHRPSRSDRPSSGGR